MNYRNLETTNEIIVVHTMGKVASTSIEKTLKEYYTKVPIYKTHFLNSQRLKLALKNLDTTSSKLNRHLQESLILRDIINNGLKNKHWKIITLIREPISRNISAFFENINSFISIDNNPKSQSKLKLNLEKAMHCFSENYYHDIPLFWFDREINDVFGLDIYQHDFCPNRGYYICQNENIELLLIRLENLNQCFEKALYEFLNLENIALKRENISERKGYSEFYQEFKQSLIVSQDYINRMYNSKYMQFFYSESEISKYRKKWEEKL